MIKEIYFSLQFTEHFKVAEEPCKHRVRWEKCSELNALFFISLFKIAQHQNSLQDLIMTKTNIWL